MIYFSTLVTLTGESKMTPNIVHILLFGVCFLLFRSYQVCTMECGTVNFVRPAVLGGSGTIKGEWPFIVAIKNHYNYLCGGTIIANRHILTAAHCIQRKNSQIELQPHELIIRLGAHNLTNPNEKEVIERNVSEIFIHDDWKDQVFETTFDADIAILLLNENITFTDNIQPVCMPANAATEHMVGSVVGYAAHESLASAEAPRRAVVRTVNSTHCFREDDVVALYSSHRTFCGGNGDGSPDLGDSGSGYFFTPGVSWAQYGIVTVIHTNATGHVFPHAYHVYTNVSMFKDWIIETVNKTGGIVGEARISITMTCDYDYAQSPDPNASSVYSCRLHNIDIQGKNFETGSFIGSHLPNKTQQDVEEIYFVNGTMSYIPSGFGFFFENIRHLVVGEVTPGNVPLGTKVVRRSDLRNLKRLRTLRFLRNDIEILHEDALWDIPDLEYIEFVQNKLKVLANDTFSRNKWLFWVDFHSNQLTFLPANLFQNNRILARVNFGNNFLKVIDQKLFQTNGRLRAVQFDSNQLKILPKHLFRNNLLLRGAFFDNNALSSVNDDLFQANVKLIAAYFRSNQIVSLPPTLFRNSPQLHIVLFQNNSITSIDESLFLRNRKLSIVSLGNNRLESLDENVFKSNSLLSIVNLASNRLKYVDVDFTVFEQIDAIMLDQNDCINATYSKKVSSYLRDDTSSEISALQEFQNRVIANCTMVRLESREKIDGFV